MTLPDEVLTLWLPVALAALLGIIGLIRGAGREVVVAAAITLGALIYQQWGNLWAVDLNSMASGITVGWAKFTLGLLILSSTTLFVGYLLGNRLVDAPMSASTRLLGGLLGLLNGAAIAGWVLRYAYDGLNARALLSDPVSDGFMIWAGWYPVVLAVLGTLFSILGPLRRARAAVERPSTSSDWAPTPASTGADTRVLPVQSGAATVALPMTDARAYQPSSTDKIESVPMWDRPRVALPEERATEPVPVFVDSAPSQEASWLGGQEPSSGETVPASASSSPTSEEDAPEKAGAVCRNCGSPMLPGAAFCTNCGTRVEQG